MIPVNEATGLNSAQVIGVTATPGTTTVTVLEWDSAGLVSVCKGASVPSSEAGYAVSCLFKNTSTGHIYSNQGTTASCTFNDLGAIAASEITLARGSILRGAATGLAEALVAKTDKQILIGDGTDVKSVAVTGDITITNAGVTAIGPGKVTAAMLATAVAPSHVIKFAGTSAAYAGGGTSTAITITGALATDVASAVIRASTNAVSIVKAVLTNDTLTVHFSADPGASTTVDYVIHRAIA